MPDVLDMIAQNPEMASALDQQQEQPPQQQIAIDPDKAADYQSQIDKLPAITRARAIRTGAILSDPELQASMESHHQAVADAQAFHHQTAQELAYAHAAHTYHDTGAYYQEAHGINPSDPNYEDKMLDLAQRYPFAKPDAELMAPLHDARKRILAASSYEAQRANEVELAGHLSKGNLKGEDLTNPAFRNPDGSPNYSTLRLVAAARESGQLPGGQPKLTPEEEIEWKAAHVDPNYNKKILQATDNPADSKYDPVAATRKTLFWNAQRKMLPAAQPSAAAAPDFDKVFRGQ